MRLIFALAALIIFPTFGGCSRPYEATYAAAISPDKGKLGEPSSYPEGFENHKRKPGSLAIAF